MLTKCIIPDAGNAFTNHNAFYGISIFIPRRKITAVIIIVHRSCSGDRQGFFIIRESPFYLFTAAILCRGRSRLQRICRKERKSLLLMGHGLSAGLAYAVRSVLMIAYRAAAFPDAHAVLPSMGVRVNLCHNRSGVKRVLAVFITEIPAALFTVIISPIPLFCAGGRCFGIVCHFVTGAWIGNGDKFICPFHIREPFPAGVADIMRNCSVFRACGRFCFTIAYCMSGGIIDRIRHYFTPSRVVELRSAAVADIVCNCSVFRAGGRFCFDRYRIDPVCRRNRLARRSSADIAGVRLCTGSRTGRFLCRIPVSVAVAVFGPPGGEQIQGMIL